MTTLTHHISGRGRYYGLALINLIFGSIVVLWAWNGFAEKISAMPQIGFVHAFSLLLSALVLGAMFSVARGLTSHTGY